MYVCKLLTKWNQRRSLANKSRLKEEESRERHKSETWAMFGRKEKVGAQCLPNTKRHWGLMLE